VELGDDGGAVHHDDDVRLVRPHCAAGTIANRSNRNLIRRFGLSKRAIRAGR
jgi:hypothetical protein